MNNDNYLFNRIKKGKKKMKKFLLLLICIAMTFTLVGCGNTNTGNEEGKTTYAEEVIVGYNNDLDTADPYQSTSSQTHWYTNATFRTLTKSNYDTGELDPVLAIRWEELSGNNTHWRVYLKEGVKFHDGTILNADDVVFTWNYAKDAANVVKPIASADAMVKEVVKVDDLTVDFILNYSIPDFMVYLEIKIYSKEAFDTMDKAEAGIIGCGPYKVGELISGVSYGLERFDDYYEGIDEFPTKKITVKVIPDLNIQVAALQKGEIDYSFRLPSTSYYVLESDPNLDFYTRDGVQSFYIGFNFRKEVWNDLNMRKVIAHAVNKDDVIAIHYEGGATATRSDNFCVPSGKGYVEVKAIGYDPEEAKRLLKEAGKEGMKVVIMVGKHNKAFAETVQNALNAVGFNAVIDEVDATNWTTLKKTGDFDIFVGDYASYTGALLFNFDRFFTVGGPSNMYGFVSQEWEDLIAGARQMSTYDEMVAEFAVLQQWVADNIPLIPVAVSKSFAAAVKSVKGVKLTPSDNLQEIYYLYKIVKK